MRKGDQNKATHRPPVRLFYGGYYGQIGGYRYGPVPGRDEFINGKRLQLSWPLQQSDLLGKSADPAQLSGSVLSEGRFSGAPWLLDLMAQAKRSRSAPARDADALAIAMCRHVNVAPGIILRVEEATGVAIGASLTEPRSLRDAT
jgi:hypothetical protein